MKIYVAELDGSGGTFLDADDSKEAERVREASGGSKVAVGGESLDSESPLERDIRCVAVSGVVILDSYRAQPAVGELDPEPW